MKERVARMFFIYFFMVLWALAVLALFMGGIGVAMDAFIAGIAMIVVSVAAAVGWFLVAAHVWNFSDATPPPNGCYAVTNNTSVIPVIAGKVVTVIPYDNLDWVAIPCPVGIHP